MRLSSCNTDKFQFVEYFRSDDTEQIRAVTSTTVPCTNCQRRLAAKSQAAFCSLAFHHLCPLEAEETGALECELAMIAFNDVAILMGRHMQLHPVATVHLEGDVIAGVRHMILSAVATVIPSAYHSDIHRQPGAVVILVPLLQSAEQNDKKRDKETYKKQGKNKIHNRKESETHSSPSDHFFAYYTILLYLMQHKVTDCHVGLRPPRNDVSLRSMMQPN